MLIGEEIDLFINYAKFTQQPDGYGAQLALRIHWVSTAVVNKTHSHHFPAHLWEVSQIRMVLSSPPILMEWRIYFMLSLWRESVAHRQLLLTRVFNYHLHLEKRKHYLSLLSLEIEYEFAPGKLLKDIFSSLFIIWKWSSIATFIFYF